jgi:hypothetical protein
MSVNSETFLGVIFSAAIIAFMVFWLWRNRDDDGSNAGADGADGGDSDDASRVLLSELDNELVEEIADTIGEASTRRRAKIVRR